MWGRLQAFVLSWLDAALATAGEAFVRGWTWVERAYRRPLSWLASRLKFAFYPLLALAAIGWLAWDWQHARSLDAAENAIFDRVVHWRPVEPQPSGRVVIVEIDECSIEHFRARGEGGWPWDRQRHADLLEQLDRGGVRAVGYDVLFTDRSPDPRGDLALEAMAAGAPGRFLFASSRLHPEFDAEAPLAASQVPGAFARVDDPRSDPRVAVLLPFGAVMAASSALVNVTRNDDGVLRDIPLYEAAGDWALPSLSLRLAQASRPGSSVTSTPTVRPNWRRGGHLPRISAADLLSDGRAICRARGTAMPDLRDRVVLVGYTAAGLNDAKPTPASPVMPGVEVLAEATEALVAGSAIRTPPGWLKYVLAGWLVTLTTFAFFRGEPATDIDSIFIATNLALLAAAFVGLTFFGYFFDIFAAVAFVSLVFGSCRLYAGVQRGRAVGNADYLDEYDPATDRWLAFARLRFVPDASLDRQALARRRREYRRRVRRFLYAGSDAVMLEGVVERKSWLHDALGDLLVLVWHAPDRETARAAAMRDLSRLERQLANYDRRLPDDGSVRVAFLCAEVSAPGRDEQDDTKAGRRPCLHEFVGRVLVATTDVPLVQREALATQSVTS
ncbi:MAG TPA: CHASE2 domain-containing protein [Steroidobacteraceae bacterium]|nr:CHASE2 domain-containing protein [Steroidobacteraceae bacterium]